MPLFFEPNHGQAQPQVKYLARARGYSLFLTRQEAVIATAARRVIRLQWSSQPISGSLEGIGQLPGVSNYFNGPDSQSWHTRIPQFAQVRYREVYPGVDLVFYGQPGGLEFDFVLRPGADPKQIRLTYNGMDRQSIDRNGDLILHVGAQELRQREPRVYQETAAGRRVAVSARYRLTRDGQVTIALAPYDRQRKLVIDPALTYSTLLGGSGFDSLSSLAVDNAGNTYLAGMTASPDLPSAAAATADATGNDLLAFVAKMNAAGDSLLYVNYLGKAVNWTRHAVVVAPDAQGSAYVAFTTLPTGQYPSTPGAYRAIGNGSAVMKFSPDGSTLVYATGIDDGGGEPASIAVDARGLAYVVGRATASFPVTPAAIALSVSTAKAAAFVAAINPDGTDLVYAARFGGSIYSQADSIAVDAAGNATIAGTTSSPDFPTTAQAFQRNIRGDSDAFVVRLNPTGTTLLFATLLGGRYVDESRNIAVDAQGNTYLVGVTNPNRGTSGNDFPTTPGAYLQPGGTGFLAKLDPSGTTLSYSALFGASFSFDITGFAIDDVGRAYVSGSNGAAIGPFPKGGLQNQATGAGAYLLRFNPEGNAMDYATYLAGRYGQMERGSSVALDGRGGVILAGATQAPDFPVTPSALQPQGHGNSDLFVMKIDFASPCVYSLNKSEDTVPAEGVTGALMITTSPNCLWWANSGAPWLTVLSDPVNSGDNTVSYAVDPNDSGAARTGTFSIGGENFTVQQPPLTGCDDSLFSPSLYGFTDEGGTGTFTIQARPDCPWRLSSTVPWLVVKEPSRGSGNGVVEYTAAANTSDVQLSGTLRIGGRFFPITQNTAQCRLRATFQPTTFPAEGGTGEVTVAPAADPPYPAPCRWRAYSNSDDLEITPNLSQTNFAVLSLRIKPNTTGEPRTLSLQAAGQIFSIEQTP